MKRFRPGVSFGDFVVHEMSMRKSRVQEEKEPDYRRGWLLWLVVMIAFGMVLVRLTQLQVIFGSRYRVLADENRLKQIRLPAARGQIVDREGMILAEDSRQGEVWLRQYPWGPAAAHVLGYLGEVRQDEVGLLKAAGGKYVIGSWIGRFGAEAVFEDVLRGEDGGRLVEVDQLGEVVREMARKEPIPGRNLDLSLSAKLQQISFSSLKNRRGAVVVSNPGNGQILALVSSPSFDPNLLVKSGLKTAEEETVLTEFLNSPELPMFDRAIGGAYPPGSTFKLVTTTAALASGKVPQNFTYEDTGVIRVGNYSYSNWLFSKRGATEGIVGFVRALTRSTDTFFYKVGEMTGPEELEKWAEIMGLGVRTGIEISGEAEGLVGGPGYKEGVKNERWFLGNTYHMAIGQGDLLFTPAQINRMTNVVASGGKLCPLTLVEKRTENPAEDCRHLEVEAEIWEIVREGMVGACSNGGTAYVFFDWNEAASQSKSKSMYTDGGVTALPLVACKTGTAEYVENGKVKTHGWLTAFAPAEDPRISVTVIMEGAGEGSDTAAPAVRQIMANYFGLEDTYPYSSIKRGSSE